MTRHYTTLKHWKTSRHCKLVTFRLYCLLPTIYIHTVLTHSTNSHNFSALEIIRLCRTELPKVKSVTFFDSAFHQTIPEPVYTYPIDQEIAKANGLRKYGFHGISYGFILRSVAQHLGKPVEKTSIIAMHVGSGASVCAIKDGKSIDTS